MSLKIWDSYNSQAKSGTDPYGTILDIYGRSGHQRNQFFMGNTGYIYHRSTFYNQSGWQNWYRFWSTKNLEANVVETLRANYNKWLTSSSTINASTVGGYSPITTGRNNTASGIMLTDGNGYANFGWINTTSGKFTGTPNRIYASSDAVFKVHDS